MTVSELKELGDIPFIADLLEKDEIRKAYQKGLYRERLYLFAMLDYVSRENHIALCTQYYENVNSLRVPNFDV